MRPAAGLSPPIAAKQVQHSLEFAALDYFSLCAHGGGRTMAETSGGVGIIDRSRPDGLWGDLFSPKIIRLTLSMSLSLFYFATNFLFIYFSRLILVFIYKFFMFSFSFEFIFLFFFLCLHFLYIYFLKMR